MRRVLLVGATVVTLIAALPRETSAITFTGEIVGTATTGYPWFWVWFDPGETWTLLYSYESDSIDGTFSRANSGLALYYPSGKLFSSLPDCGPYPCQIGPFLTVEQSLVTSFLFFTWDLFWYLDYSSWSFDGIGGGPLTITNPVPAPENANTVLLLGVALLGTLAFRRYQGQART